MPLLPHFMCVCLYMQRVKDKTSGVRLQTLFILFILFFGISSLTGLELVVPASWAGQQAPSAHLSPTARTGITTMHSIH